MSVNPIGLAVPFFFGLILFEMVLSTLRSKKVYRLNDGIADLTCGMGDQVIGIFKVLAYLPMQLSTSCYSPVMPRGNEPSPFEGHQMLFQLIPQSLIHMRVRENQLRHTSSLTFQNLNQRSQSLKKRNQLTAVEIPMPQTKMRPEI